MNKVENTQKELTLMDVFEGKCYLYNDLPEYKFRILARKCLPFLSMSDIDRNFYKSNPSGLIKSEESGLIWECKSQVSTGTETINKREFVPSDSKIVNASDLYDDCHNSEPFIDKIVNGEYCLHLLDKDIDSEAIDWLLKIMENITGEYKEIVKSADDENFFCYDKNYKKWISLKRLPDFKKAIDPGLLHIYFSFFKRHQDNVKLNEATPLDIYEGNFVLYDDLGGYHMEQIFKKCFPFTTFMPMFHSYTYVKNTSGNNLFLTDDEDKVSFKHQIVNASQMLNFMGTENPVITKLKEGRYAIKIESIKYFEDHKDEYRFLVSQFSDFDDFEYQVQAFAQNQDFYLYYSKEIGWCFSKEKPLYKKVLTSELVNRFYSIQKDNNMEGEGFIDSRFSKEAYDNREIPKLYFVKTETMPLANNGDKYDAYYWDYDTMIDLMKRGIISENKPEEKKCDKEESMPLFSRYLYDARKIPTLYFTQNYSVEDRCLFVVGDEYPTYNYNYERMIDLMREGVISINKPTEKGNTYGWGAISDSSLPEFKFTPKAPKKAKWDPRGYKQSLDNNALERNAPRSYPNSLSKSSFKKDLEILINKHSKENESNTPDFILANYLNNCLDSFDLAYRQREKWYNK